MNTHNNVTVIPCYKLLRSNDSSQVRLIQVVLAIILALVVLPVLGQAILRYFVPQEVDPFPPVGETYQPGEAPQTLMAATMPPISTAISLDEEEIEQIEQSINFSLLVPGYVPNECYWQSYRVILNGVQLSYTCLCINQQQVQNVQQPRFGEGSTEEVSVGNNPAFYIRGNWMQLEGQNEPIWVGDAGSWLIFEHDDIIIRLRTGSLTKEELIRITDSMLE